MPRQDLLDRFVAVLKDLDGSAGNGRLREALGWTQETYDGVRAALLADGIIARGRGRGGSVSLVGFVGAMERAVDAIPGLLQPAQPQEPPPATFSSPSSCPARSA